MDVWWWQQRINVSRTMLDPRCGFLCTDVVRLVQEFLKCWTHHRRDRKRKPIYFVVQQDNLCFEACRDRNPDPDRVRVEVVPLPAHFVTFEVLTAYARIFVGPPMFMGFGWHIRWTSTGQENLFHTAVREEGQLHRRLTQAFPSGCLNCHDVKRFLLEYFAPGRYVDYRLVWRPQ